MAVRAGSGYVDVTAKPSENFSRELRNAITAKLNLAGAEGGKAFQKAFADRLKTYGVGGDTASKLFSGLLPAAVVVGVVGGLAKMASGTAKYADEVRKLRDESGASAEDSSRFIAVFRDLGIESGTAARPLLTLSQTVEAGGGHLKDFFTTAELGKFKTQDLTKTVLDLGDRYKSLQDPLQKNNLLIDAFRKRSDTLRPILEASRSEIKKWTDQAKASGLIFNDQQLAQARNYEVAVRTLGDTFKGLEVQGGKIAIPALTAAIEILDEAILAGEKVAGGYGHVLDDVFGKPTSKPNRLRELVDITEVFRDITRSAAKDGADKLSGSLEHLTESAASDEAAAKKLNEVFTQAFKDIDSAGADLDARLDAMIPKLGEVIKSVPVGDVDRTSAGQAAADQKLADAKNTLAKAEERLGKVQADAKHSDIDLSSAEHDVANARDEVARATDNATTAHQSLADALEATLRDNAGKETAFASDLEKLNARFGSIAVRGGDEVKSSFLEHLQELGPGAVPILDSLVRQSNSKLGEMAGLFGDSIQAAKKAVDFQFDKWPANWAERIERARTAAIGEGTKLIGEFNALGDNPQLQDKLGDQVDGLAQRIEAVLGPSLTKAQRDFLHTAESGDTAAQKVHALQKFIDDLHSKHVDLDVGVNFPKGIIPSDPNAVLTAVTTHGSGDVVQGARAAGGSVMAGRPYLVGERGPELVVPRTSGDIVPNDALGTQGPIVIHNVIELDGEVLARNTVVHNAKAMEQHRRSHGG